MHESLPLKPGKIIGVHLNYPSRAAQRGRTPAYPGYFFKPASSVSGSGTPIERPAGTELLAFEGEIALVIGDTIRHADPETAWSAVSGITAANDFGVYDLRAADKGSNVRSKGGDGFTPLGPNVIPASAVDPTALRIRTWVNGELVQQDTSDALIFPFAVIVADLSQQLTLEPGDVILTGTPAGASVVQPGDVVEVEVDAPTAPGSPTSGRLVTHIAEGHLPIPAYSAPATVDDDIRADAWGSAEAAGLDSPFELTDELKAKLGSVGTATLSAQLRKRGLDNTAIEGLTSSRPARRMIGRARTLRYVPAREDLAEKFGGGYNAQKRAFDSLNPGDVLVIEARGELGSGTVGDILALRAQVKGAAGIVTDGGVRDFDAVAALDIPTYSAAQHPALLGRRHVPWDADLTIACGGATVQPGDIIVGDGGGLVVIPPHLVEEVVDAAVEQELEETFVAERVSAGDRIDGLFPMNAEWKARFTAWRTAR